MFLCIPDLFKDPFSTFYVVFNVENRVTWVEPGVEILKVHACIQTISEFQSLESEEFLLRIII